LSVCGGGGVVLAAVNVNVFGVAVKAAVCAANPPHPSAQTTAQPPIRIARNRLQTGLSGTTAGIGNVDRAM
jgi:hypothetical protein